LNKPKEDLVFSHGDYCLPNIFLEGGEITGFIDLGRAGIADKWQDIALAIRSLEYNLKSDKYIDLFFRYLEIEPDYEKIKYYILLDELF
jgi:kanamycin kinase/aminoglycoside 3'-phosphotransferase-3